MSKLNIAKKLFSILIQAHSQTAYIVVLKLTSLVECFLCIFSPYLCDQNSGQANQVATSNLESFPVFSILVPVDKHFQTIINLYQNFIKALFA
jgi:hypothetical protein